MSKKQNETQTKAKEEELIFGNAFLSFPTLAFAWKIGEKGIKERKNEKDHINPLQVSKNMCKKNSKILQYW